MLESNGKKVCSEHNLAVCMHACKYYWFDPGVGCVCHAPNKRDLVLPLNKHWFEMIKNGSKSEEYRSVSEYWKKRLCLCVTVIIEDMSCQYSFYNFDRVVFTCGYPSKDDTERRLVFNRPVIRHGYGRQEWGAEPEKEYFCISWGDRIYE